MPLQTQSALLVMRKVSAAQFVPNAAPSKTTFSTAQLAANHHALDKPAYTNISSSNNR
jgi:hypothetical protein